MGVLIIKYILVYRLQGVVYFIENIANLIHFWMYEVSPSILESRLLSSNNIVDAAVVAITDKENGQVSFAVSAHMA